MIFTTTIRGVDARIVRVSAIIEAGLPGLRIHGLGAAAEREARVRVAAALSHAEHTIDRSTTVTCDAGGGTVDGVGLDLAIALAVAGDVETPVAAIGELSFAGDVRPVRGVLPAVEALAPHVSVVVVARENAAEAALVPTIRVVAVRSLKGALGFLAGDDRCGEIVARREPSPPSTYPDMRDIAGQPLARRALEIAAAGGHNLLLIGGPGAGKTMCARRLIGILPPMTEDEALEVTRVHSAAGLNVGGGLISTRPFRAPHHSTTPAGLVGGGASVPRPGEASLAHQGVLFLDELSEFARPTLEVLREPLTSGEVVLCRASGTIRFPSRCIVVASMSPCPCGRLGTARCRCAAADAARYRARIPDALLERFDLRVRIDPIDLAALDGTASGEESERVRARVVSVRARTHGVPLDAEARERLARAVAEEARPRNALERTTRVASTISRLGGSDAVRSEHLAEAMSLVLGAATSA